MNKPVLSFISAILMGFGATLMIDLWALFLEHTFKINPSNMCLVGRWIRYMPVGIFRHSNIGSAPQQSGECAIGWTVHYLTGVVFALIFVTWVGSDWLQDPRLIPAIIFGMVTVLVPFLVMQPLFGLGFAASKTPNPVQAGLRSLMNHVAFGVGLYLFGWLISWLL